MRVKKVDALKRRTPHRVARQGKNLRGGEEEGRSRKEGEGRNRGEEEERNRKEGESKRSLII